MPMRLGVLAYPLFVLSMQLLKPSAVPAFEAVEAFSPETSRKPAGLEVSFKATRRAVRKGLLIPVGDGRYYLDRNAVRRSDRRWLALLIGAGVLFVPLALFLL